MSDPDERDDADGADETVDPEQLKRQLSDIKGAMGLEERYPGQRRLWLVYGVVIGLASILLELIFIVNPDAPGMFYFWLWVTYALVTGLSLMRLASGMPRDIESVTVPDWRVLFGTLVLAFGTSMVQFYPALSAAERALPSEEFAPLEGAFVYSLVISISGIGFLFAGNALRAYRIRKRDRRVFYGAGVWMLVFAALFTSVEWLRPVGYGLFGVCFLAYSLAAYALLGRSADATAS